MEKGRKEKKSYLCSRKTTQKTTQMDAISNIIFDLGGVVYDICYENVANAFVQHGVTNLGEFYSRSFQTHEMDLLEEGLDRLRQSGAQVPSSSLV